MAYMTEPKPWNLTPPCGHDQLGIKRSTYRTADMPPHHTEHVRATCQECGSTIEALWESGILTKGPTSPASTPSYPHR